MRQRISYNSDDYTGSTIIWIVLLCLVFCCFFWWTPGEGTGWGWGYTWGWIIVGCLFLWWIFALCFVPLDVYADDDEVRIRRPFKTKRIKLDEISSIEPYQVPKNASKKALRSSPVKAFGSWGQYKDDKAGDYFAYYGKPDSTVLITLKNGKKYVVGASDAQQLSDYINERLNKS